MNHSITAFLIVCPLVFLAGFVDAIAGGGGLISLPAYIIAGIPMHFSIATNKLSSSTGTFVSTLRMCKNKHMDLPVAVPSIIAALLGSFIGSNVVLLIDERILKYILIAILPIAAFYVLRKKSFEGDGSKIPRKQVYLIAVSASLLIGFYDGLYGPGTGTFLLLIYTGLAKMDLMTASGNTKLVNLSSNLAALVTFIINGKILFLLGLTASIFSIAGHYLGAGVVMKSGTKAVKPIILMVLVLLFLKIILDR